MDSFNSLVPQPLGEMGLVLNRPASPSFLAKCRLILQSDQRGEFIGIRLSDCGSMILVPSHIPGYRELANRLVKHAEDLLQKDQEFQREAAAIEKQTRDAEIARFNEKNPPPS